ncbi:uncharacterized protein LOC122261602 [Penaeus japonicus]|uniref:uncharacterized protein LOC122261602 n=1 Tax=Penaeus japonicus TaxID=27405 RepID=UPI001C712E02|nr:uncharacterized protein LOC122261602 [Penaeus japonicus]
MSNPLYRMYDKPYTTQHPHTNFRSPREMGERYKLYHSGVENKRNGKGTALSPEMKEGILQGHRESDCVIWLKVEVEKLIVNVICAHASQVGCEEHEKDEVWELLGGVTVHIPETEEVCLGGNLNGQAGEGNRETNVIGGHGIGRRNLKGNRIVDFAVANQLAALNTFFRKRRSQLITYCSGGRELQIDYIMSRRGLKRVHDCKV